MISLKKLILDEGMRSRDDGYYYHVTLAAYQKSIERTGISTKATPTVTNYASYSKGKIFLTDVGALDWWVYTIGMHAYSNYDNEKYHDIAVFRIKKSDLTDVKIDDIGSHDSKGDSYYVEKPIPPNIVEFVKIEGSPF